MIYPYTPPTISNELGRNVSEAAADRNFYSRGAHSPVLSEIDGVPVEDLLAKYGSPLFVYSEHEMREKARRMRNAFLAAYKKTEFAWSYKTNYINAICQVFHSEGWMAEVVSDFEYQKARRHGLTGKDIVFNGPYKPDEALTTAMDDGALIQIDNWDELSRLEDLVETRKKPVNIGIRVWMDPGIKPVWAKFGFAIENGEAARAAGRIVRNKKFHLFSINTHIGTYILAPEAYTNATRKIVALREQIEADHKHLVDCVNLGGGFPSYSLLHGMAGPAEQAIQPVETYARAITDVLNRLPERKRPLLRMECGRYLIDDAGYLLTKVVALKGVGRPVSGREGDLSANDHKERLLMGEDSKVGYIVDAGVNLLYTAAWFQINALPARVVGPPPVPSRLYGSLCMAIDVIRDHIDLPPLEVGDILTLHPVGAYNFTQSMQFIQYRPAVVLIGEGGKPEIIRERENLDYVEELERLPSHLTEKK